MSEPTLKKVLIVDDASLVRLYYRQALEQAGFLVEEALNGVEALERLALGVFDVLIVDVNMPQMDGLTFLRALRSSSDSPSDATPVLVTSTESKQGDKDMARAAGANFYLVKPVPVDVLSGVVQLLSGAANG